jgi:protein subunit release factor A
MKDKRKLFSVTIKDCKVTTFTVGGHGGAGKDTSNTGVRILHPQSGAVGKATESRSQAVNKRMAFKRMGESKAFQAWARLVASELTSGKSVDTIVGEMMQPENLKVEYLTYEGWKPEPL